MKAQINEFEHPYIEYEYGNKIHYQVYDLLAVEANYLARKVSSASPRQNILAEKKAFRRHFVVILSESLLKHFVNMTPKQAVEMAQAALGDDRVTTWIWKPGWGGAKLAPKVLQL